MNESIVSEFVSAQSGFMQSRRRPGWQKLGKRTVAFRIAAREHLSLANQAESWILADLGGVDLRVNSEQNPRFRTHRRIDENQTRMNNMLEPRFA
jgi:hypothetical protein